MEMFYKLILVGISVHLLFLSVCIKFLGKVKKTLTSEEENDKSIIETRLRKACKKAKGKDNRFVSI